MPKEIIQYGGIARYTTEKSVIDVEEPTLQVKWFHDPEHVQVQFTVSQEFLDQITGGNGVTLTSNSLSRREINHLIRTLRRARDNAYGKDE